VVFFYPQELYKNILQIKGATNPKYVVQVNTDNARIQKITLNNAVNLQKHYGGEGKLDIEIDF
jgi:hypothetical protein